MHSTARIFWIYFIVTLFFIVLGLKFILYSSDPNLVLIALASVIGNLSLMLIVYFNSIIWGPRDYDICVMDKDPRCLSPTNRIWLLINALFIGLLLISWLWAVEIGNNGTGPLRTVSGILILLGGLLMCNLGLIGAIRSNATNIYNIPFWISVIYIITWVGLTLYAVLTDT